MIRCVIIDDDEFAIDSIKELINEVKDYQDFEVVKTFNSSKEAINELRNLSFDLLFVDYEMPGYNGLEIVKKLNLDVYIIFVTSHNEMNENLSNELNLTGFLSKPPKKESLIKILKKLDFFSQKIKPPERIMIPDGSKEYFFNTNEIYYIESDTKYKDFFGVDNKDSIANIAISFAKLEKILSRYGFEQISKSHMVNINYIAEKTPQKIKLTNGKVLYLGDSRKKTFINRLMSIFKA